MGRRLLLNEVQIDVAGKSKAELFVVGVESEVEMS